MTTREHAPTGAPCWVDLMTSDTAASRDFYCALFGWQAEEPAEEFGGYFCFSRGGVLVAGCMASQPMSPVTDVWSVYLASDDARKTVEVAEANGGQVIVSPMDVGDLGTMAVVTDPAGAAVGVWQPQRHAGFGVLSEAGAPSWFELYSRQYDAAVAYYGSVFHWDTDVVSDTPEFRYRTLRDGNGGWLAGVMDAGDFLPEGVPSHWAVYFGSDDTDASLTRVVELGGSVLRPAEDTPYGRIATVADPNGGVFKLVHM